MQNLAIALCCSFALWRDLWTFSIDLGIGEEGEKLLTELHPLANITDYIKVDFLFLLLLNQLESRGREIAALY